MEFFAYVYKSDLKSGQAYIWFNRQQHHLSDGVIGVRQAKYQTSTEKRLLKQVQKEYPKAILFDDTDRPGSYRCIKVVK